ncbi:MAG: phosphomethylpyrimidine synthase ThiC [Deltaproteobacteria bacterium]|nr:phosphomethylpyrimidine synthase ThiC [Deltaproteobacteria bacterium]
MTQLDSARAGRITDEMGAVAAAEGRTPEFIREGAAAGRIVVTRNCARRVAAPIGIGAGLRTKVNANIGTSRDEHDLDAEIEKARVSVSAGADTLMDLSTGGSLAGIRSAVMESASVPLGTVPIYQAAVRAADRGASFCETTPDEWFAVVEEQAREGVDFMTVHCGVTLESKRRADAAGRVLGVVSRGGALTLEWMRFNGRENPFFSQYDRLMEVFHEYDVAISLGDGFRPGAGADATDRAQVQELIILGELCERAWKAGVQVMIEGPGHVPINQIAANVQLEKCLCRGAPFYVLGPLVTDSAPGYDHISAAIGGAVAGAAGADFLCYVTASEHLRLPSVEDVREGVVAARIAAHAADVAKGIPGAAERDAEMSRRRRALDWEGMFAAALDPARARALRSSSRPSEDDVCTMCGPLCAIKMQEQVK